MFARWTVRGLITSRARLLHRRWMIQLAASPLSAGPKTSPAAAKFVPSSRRARYWIPCLRLLDSLYRAQIRHRPRNRPAGAQRSLKNAHPPIYVRTVPKVVGIEVYVAGRSRRSSWFRQAMWTRLACCTLWSPPGPAAWRRVQIPSPQMVSNGSAPTG